MTITGVDFAYTHNYAGYGFGYVDGTALSGTVSSIVISGVDSFGSRHGGHGTSSRIEITDINQSLNLIVELGVDFSGNDYIIGSYTTSTTTSLMMTNQQQRDLDQVFFGGAGYDVILGMGGNDEIDGGTEADYLDGGDGIDVLSVASAQWGQWIHLGQGTSGTGDTFLNFESLRGSAFNDHLAGSDGVNVIYGGAGDDFIAGGIGDDLLYGQAGNDQIYVEAGVKTMNGGDGFDTLNFKFSAQAVNVTLVGPGMTGTLSNNSTYFDFEGLVGSAYGDILIGTDGVDAISGGKGADVIMLGGGNDYLNIAYEDVVAGEYDYIADFAVGDSIYMPDELPLYVFDVSGTTYAIANAPGGGY